MKDDLTATTLPTIRKRTNFFYSKRAFLEIYQKIDPKVLFIATVLLYSLNLTNLQNQLIAFLLFLQIFPNLQQKFITMLELQIPNPSLNSHRRILLSDLCSGIQLFSHPTASP